jgi:hypothetical protein
MVAVDKETSATVVHPWFGWLRGVAGVVALVIAGLYGLLFFEVLVVAGTEDAGRGILGVAAVVFAWRSSCGAFAVASCGLSRRCCRC